MLKEFRQFIARGNVIDLAVGVIIGAAFTAIVTSLVDDIINPLIGLIIGGRADFTNYFIQLSGVPAATLEEARKAGAVLAYGAFFTAIVNFLIIALVIFLMIRLINRIMIKEEPAGAPSAPTLDQQLLAEIRDLLRERRGGGSDQTPRL